MNTSNEIVSSSKSNQFIWFKVKSSFGTEEYIPRIVDITAGNIQKYTNKWRQMKCLTLILLLLLILLIICIVIVSILLPILLIQHKSIIIIPNNVTIFTTTLTTFTTISTTTSKCAYPNVPAPLDTCVNIMIDSNNCGTVGNICPTNSSCSAGICSYVPGVQLTKPNIIWSSATNGSADDQMFTITLPWNITLYNITSIRATVTTDGVLCLGGCATTYTESMLPANVFSSATALPFWDDLYIYANTSQGIYYQSEGKSPNRTLTFEYYMSHYLEVDQYYHFQVIFFESAPGVVQYKYFAATDGGDTCTIGVQASNTGPFILYAYDQPSSVQQNMILTFDTNLGTYNKSTIT